MLQNLLELLGISQETPGRAALLRAVALAIGDAGASADSIVDTIVTAIDELIAAQLDEILHAPSLAALESAARGLWLTLDRATPAPNVEVLLLSCTKAELTDHFAGEPAPAESPLARMLRSHEPIAAIISPETFDGSDADATLLSKLGDFASDFQAPFLAHASRELTDASMTDSFAALHEKDSARFLALFAGRILQRPPYRIEQPFSYAESGRPLFGSPVHAFAISIVRSFVLYGWAANVTGPVDGLIEDLPCTPGTSLAVEHAWVAAGASELRERRFAPVVALEPARGVEFGDVPSLRRNKDFGPTEEGQARAFDFRCDGELPYIFIIARVAHYVKTVYRIEHLFEQPRGARAALARWLDGITADARASTPEYRRSHPLRMTRLESGAVDGELRIRVRPHFKRDGRFFALSINVTLRPS